jgi:hypothetical protein
VTRLLVLRTTRAMREIAVRFETTLRTAYPAPAGAIHAALVAQGAWPGPGILWADVTGERSGSLTGHRGESASGDSIASVLERVREMPGGIRLFLLYAFGILFLIGASLRFIIDQAISAPVSLPGLVAMVLLAYTIFTTTLVIQRKQAARRLALGLASLTIPLVPLLVVSGLAVEAVFVAALAILLFRGLLRPEVRMYLNEV